MCSCCAMYSLLDMAHNQTQVRRLEMIETLPSQSRVGFFCFFIHCTDVLQMITLPVLLTPCSFF